MLHFKIVSPERIVFEDDVDQVTIPTKDGEITVLPNHLPLVAALQAGELLIKTGAARIPMAISGGFVEVQPKSQVIVLADTAEKVEEIDLERAEAARQRAQMLAKDKITEASEYAALAAKMEKELVRLKIARKYRRDHRVPTPVQG
ncbi:ATP synthase F1 subunit epsilon [Candidatus Uhrbacteria bacterium]|nr:ATP synthase F1 subunit epsilon [Candidatus Uhrbacteria bacterium]